MKRLSVKGARFIANWEGFEPAPYNDPAGHATIGYGHLIHLGPVTNADHKKWGEIGRREALRLLRKDARDFERAVRRFITVDLTQEQFDALVSFTYNLGAGALESSTLRQRLNDGDYKSVPGELNRWVRAGGEVLPGLVNRRHAEGLLFSRGDYG